MRERVKPATIQRGAPRDDRVVLFVHGAGTPAEVAFDVPYADYSWMAYLAAAGFDVFSMDMTGYGRSTRPTVMNDVCNLSAEQQTALGGTPCQATHEAQLTTIASDWDDLDAVVDYIRALRDVPRVSLVGWSLGGPRAGGYASRNPGKVAKLVLLAPAYSPRRRPATAAAEPRARRRVQRAIARRVHGELGAAGRLPESIRAGGRRGRVGRDARVRSGRRVVGAGRAARAEHHRRGASAKRPSSACRRRR